MNCVIVQNRLAPEGRTRCVAEFVRALNELGAEPTILCLSYADPDIGLAFGQTGLRYRLLTMLPWSPALSAHRPEVLLTNLLARKPIQRLAPDLVFNSNGTWAFLPPGPRYIHYVHFPFKASLRYMSRFARGIWKSYARSMDLLMREGVPPPRSVVVANSEFVRDGIRDAYAIDATVIYPPGWTGELREGRSDARRVVTLGSLHPDKAQLEQVKIARRLPSWGFTLLGSPAAPGYARKVREAARVTPNVELVVRPTRRRIEQELARASHFLHTNAHEGFGIAAVEAAAAGCIPVVPDQGGVREIVRAPQLRFSDVDGCVTALRLSTGGAGRRLLAEVQRDLPRFSADAFRSAMRRLVLGDAAVPARSDAVVRT